MIGRGDTALTGRERWGRCGYVRLAFLLGRGESVLTAGRGKITSPSSEDVIPPSLLGIIDSTITAVDMQVCL